MAAVRWMVCLCLLLGVADAKKILIRHVSARVISVEHDDGNRIKLIAGFKERGRLPYGKPEEWTGVFLKNGHPIEGTRFRVRGMFGKDEGIVAVVFAATLPSEEVEVGVPDYYKPPTPLSDPPDHPPINGRVGRIITWLGGGGFRMRVDLDPHADPGDVSSVWTGVFTKNGHDVPNTTFKLSIDKDGIWGAFYGTTRPSRTVRLYPPDAENQADAAAHAPNNGAAGSARAADERHTQPIDARVIDGMGDEPETYKVEIGFGRDIELGRVTKDWTGAFTKDGKVIDGTTFKLDDVYMRVAHATIIGDDPPSATVRLFPPGYTP